LYPNGSTNKAEFKKFASKSLPQIPTDDSVDYLFSCMDLNKDGTIDFTEFLIYQSVTCPSSNVIDTEEVIKCKPKK
jgi:Ca2+-binding EF-hand superfamily protein